METTMEAKQMEQEYMAQMSERRKRLIEALTEDNGPTIAPARLAKALGVTKESIINAAWGNHLPYGWAHQGEMAKSRRTLIFKDKVWMWFYGGMPV